MRVLVVAAVLAAGPARAEHATEIPPKARDLATQGRTAHDQGDYARAIAAFKEAYVIAPAPALLFNLAQAYRLQGNCDDAAIMYRRYLGTRPDLQGRALAEEHLATVERCVKQRALNVPLDAKLAYLGSEKPPADLGVVDTPGPAPGQLRKQVGLGFAIGGATGVALAAFYAFRAHDASQDVERLYAMGAKWQDIEPRHSEGVRAATMARVFGIGGGVALATGATLYLLGRRAERVAPITIAPTKGGAQVHATWRF